MITFNTQKEFEDAVMAVIRERLTIYLRGDYTDGCISQLNAELQDKSIPFAGDNA